MLRLNFLLCVFFLNSLMLPAYSTFHAEDYSSCIKKGRLLGSNDLMTSYDLCFDYYSNRYVRIQNRNSGLIQDESRKSSSAIALAELLLKPVQGGFYGFSSRRAPQGQDVATVISYLKNTLDFLILFSDNDPKHQSLQRYSTLYEVMLTIEQAKKFPQTVPPGTFATLYEKLSKFDRGRYTATIPLYMAHLIIFNGVRPDQRGDPDQMGDEDALALAQNLINSIDQKKSSEVKPVHRLSRILKQRQEKKSRPETIFTTPSLLSEKEKQHKKLLEDTIEVRKRNIQQSAEPDAAGLAVVLDGESDGRKRRRIKRIIIDDEKEEEEEVRLEATDQYRPDMDPSLQPPARMIEDPPVPSVLTDVSSALTAVPVQPRPHAKRKRVASSDDEYNYEEVEKYIVEQWKKGIDPVGSDVIAALGYKDIDPHKIGSLKYYLKTKYPDIVPKKSLSPTQCMINFFIQCKNVWEDMKVHYKSFNKIHPSLVTTKYFQDHGALVRTYLALKEQISDSSKRQKREQFQTVVRYIEDNPMGTYEDFRKQNQKVNIKYFKEVKGIYKDYALIFNNVSSVNE